MRLVILGTGPFAVPAFGGLFETAHEIAALVTRPLEPARGREIPAATPLRDLVHAHGTPIFDPPDINGPDALASLQSCRADLLVVCDYGQILSAGALATARLGGLNVHGSLLPKYRGAAPIHWAVYHGEKETGVSVIHMTPRIDAGPLVAQARTEIGPDETAVELEKRLAEIGAWLVRRAIDSLESGRLEALPQDHAQASRAPRLKKTDGLIDWSRPAAAIRNQVRAFEPWPKTYTYWHRPGAKPMRLILGPVAVVDPGQPGAAPGAVLECTGDRLIVAAGQGALALSSLQPAGKRMLPVAEFLRGNRVQRGDRLGPE